MFEIIKRLSLADSSPALNLSRIKKRVVVLVVDLCLCILSVWFAYYLKVGEFISPTSQGEWDIGAIWAGMISIIFALPIFMALGLYRAIFRYSGWPALMAVVRAIGIYSLLYISIFTVIGFPGVPRTVGIIQPILLLLLIGASRAFARVWLGDQYIGILKKSSLPKVLIYGAGSSGRQLVAALANSQDIQVVGFLDDNVDLQQHILNGQKIYSPSDLINLASCLSISQILLAMPNISRKRRNEILMNIRAARIAVRTLPSMSNLAQGKLSATDLCEPDIDDLLGREPVMPDQNLLATSVVGKVVMVTGAGGSIGSELCRQIVLLGPKNLLLIDQNEFALYSIHQELEEKCVCNGIRLVPLLGSILSKERMRQITSTWKVDTIYHAAAYKHVPIVEHNPVEGIRNNIFGTLYLAQIAAETDVSRFVLISTDKAVRPTNIMGASKRVAEMILQAMAEIGSNTKFSMVRFGNVLDSSGSVVPRFRQQISKGGPITLTHPDVTRFFMTVREAAQLVIQAGAMAQGGDVFMLHMGELVKIVDLAYRMVELSGMTVKDGQNPDGDIAIEMIGLRPGEKLYEELLVGEDHMPTSHQSIMKANEEFISWPKLKTVLCSLEESINLNDINHIRIILKETVAGYSASDAIVDWIYLEKNLMFKTQKA